MRVLHLSHGSPLLGDVGGVELYADALVRAQGSNHQDSALLTLDRRPQAKPGLHQLSEHCWALGQERAPRSFRETWSAPATAAAIAQLNPELIHVHHLAHLGLDALSAASCPVVLTLHDYHLLCVRGQLVDRDLERCTGPELGRCGSCVAEHLRLTPGLSKLSGLSRQLGALGKHLKLHAQGRSALAKLPVSAQGREQLRARMEAGRGVLAGAQVVVAPSQSMALRVERLCPQVRVEVLGLPLVAPLNPAPDPGTGPLRVLFVGALIPTKGAHLLEQAMRGLDAELSVWGPAPVFDADPEFGVRLKQRLGTQYKGCFGAEQRQAVLDQADLLVLPSIWEENSPLVVREALAAGLRVLCSDRGGMGELDPRIVQVPAGDVQALRAALTQEIRRGRGRWRPALFPMGPHLLALEQIYGRAKALWLR